MKQQKVLISGASIAGPALAYWLQLYGFDVTVVEKAPEVRKGGYRVDLRGKAVEVAARMGILHEIRKQHTNVKGSSLINRQGRRYVNLDDPNLFGMRRPEDVEIMRGDLADILYQATKGKVNYLFGNSITSLEEREGHVDVTFRNGSWGTYDLVVGADGLHSTVRRLAFGPEGPFIHHLGYNLCIFSVPNVHQLDRWELVYPSVKKGVNIFSTHPSEEAKAFFLFQTPSTPVYHRDVKGQKQQLIDQFYDEGPEIRKLLQYVDTAPDFYFDSISQVRMQQLYKGRVVLLGDAGYCPSPASGQGTSLALVGAYVLAGEMIKGAGDHSGVFGAYQAAMQPFIDLNQRLADTALKGMIPGSRIQLHLQNFMLRLLLRFPRKKKIFQGIFKGMHRAVDRAAHGIALVDY